ncbi:uncharacterized protein BP5553_02327 [Venustampulla echinocandica]|uniref:Uncharacterized protein n=1 Tax=Venustampulla echinocandica TaxID=2656787 RepID=A0A370U3K7_9HELO|nr:uncharacterized protein BP5553_02327 [Venustampulla echinocandica]RDL42348.1 hypothetical protein BP5553_02327 [Venustampulla echinocandica]
MKKVSSDPPSSLDRIRSWARSKAHGPSSLSNAASRPSILPITSSDLPQAETHQHSNPDNDVGGNNNATPELSRTAPGSNVAAPSPQPSGPAADDVVDNTPSIHPPPAPSSQADGEGSVINKEKPKEKNVALRFWLTSKTIILSSYINFLLVFVPVGIAAEAAHLSPGIIFAMNAIAIVPLAGLLSHATESVAKRMGDTVGALMNVTFGNAVELIIFMYVYLTRDQGKNEREALFKALSYQSRPISVPMILPPCLFFNEIRIVQASLLGSILANLLLILGMAFLLGGLRFREQIYNSTVTQMSACLLSLSVMSLLLPTAFHASFNTLKQEKATKAVLQVSRGTSVVLLIVYGMYLLFQLKSHAYMYQSTPQHILDEECVPGPVAHWMESSDDDDSSSSSSDSDTSSGSNTTAKRIKRVMRGGRRRRKSSSGSKDTADMGETTRTPSLGTSSHTPVHTDHFEEAPPGGSTSHRFGAIVFAEDADDEARTASCQHGSGGCSKRDRKHLRKVRERERRHQKKERKRARKNEHTIAENAAENPLDEKLDEDPNGPRRVDFASANVDEIQTDNNKRPRTLRGLSLRPAIPRTFAQNVFTQPASTPPLVPSVGSIPRVRYGIRRTNSLPDRLNQIHGGLGRQPSGAAQTPHINSLSVAAKVEDEEEEENISRTTAVVLLLVSTGLVAVCAEFMVDSISAVVAGNSGVSETFIGLIILPIVGNAAEHVTAVTVATKNKMDLAIGVAVGSSIQIALFVTPFVVLLGWCMGKEMSLYFTLFETVSLFVSAFIVNFLVLDGRSNFLEGALLCAAYVIIAVAAFFYPPIEDQSNLGGNADAANKMIRSLQATHSVSRAALPPKTAKSGNGDLQRRQRSSGHLNTPASPPVSTLQPADLLLARPNQPVHLVLRPVSSPIMVYDWENKEEICYRMYIEEKKSLEEIMDYMKEEHKFAPSWGSKRAFQTQFKRWDFPSKQNPAHKNAALVQRVKELWDCNTSQRDMLKALNDEGFDIKERELMRVRAKNRWLLRVPNGMKTKKRDSDQDVINQLQQALYPDGQLADADGEPEDVEDIALPAPKPTLPRAESPPLSPEVLAKRQERLAKLQAESAERWAARKRRRRTRGWAGLPADPPGPPRFPSETTIDESKAFLSLDNNLYRDLRTRFQRICEEADIIKKTIAGPERWEGAKDRLIQESPHLQSVFWHGEEDRGERKLALDVVCSDVTKRMRTLERRMTIAEAKNTLGINPEESRQLRNAFYLILKADHFTSKLEAGEDHWKELKTQWINSSDLLLSILAPGDADPQHQIKVKAMEVLCRDVMKRLRDDQTKRDPTRKKKFDSNFTAPDPVADQSGNSPDSNGFPPSTHTALVQAASQAQAQTPVQAPSRAQPYVQPHPQPHTQPQAQSGLLHRAQAQARQVQGQPHGQVLVDHNNMQIDPSLLLAAANDPSLLNRGMQNQFSDQQYADQQYVAQAAQAAFTPASSIAFYFRLHPASEIQTNSRLWVSTLSSVSVDELRQLATVKFPGTIALRIEGVIKQPNGHEMTLPIDQDEELGAYLAEINGVKPIFSVQLVAAWKND